MARRKSPQEIKSILKLIPNDSETVLVGGHAINLWAIAYRDDIPELENYLPFSSEDLDFLGGKIEAVELQERLGGTLTFPESFSPSPNTAILTTQIGKDKLRIDFLGNVFGLDTEQVASSAIAFESEKLEGVRIKVLNPILCLGGKLRSYTGLPQDGRQDKKHLQIAILIARQYTKKVCLFNQPRDGLRLVEHLAKLAKSEAGLKVWQQDRIDLLQTIPQETITLLEKEKWQKFKQIRLPQIVNDIATKRERYQKIVEERQSRRREIKRENEQDR